MWHASRHINTGDIVELRISSSVKMVVIDVGTEPKDSLKLPEQGYIGEVLVLFLTGNGADIPFDKRWIPDVALKKVSED